MITRTILAVALLALTVRGQGFPVRISLDSTANGWGEGQIESGPDLDGDGIPDFITTSHAGVALCSGSDFSVLHSIPASTSTSGVDGLTFWNLTISYGGFVGWTDDTNGDGYPEALVRRSKSSSSTLCIDVLPCSEFNSLHTGFAVISGDTFLPLLVTQVSSTTGFAGKWVVSFNDLNGDGVREVVQSGSDATRVVDVPGVQYLATIPGTVVETGDVQPCVASGGDLDGDGWDDLFIGYRNGGVGLVEVLSGDPAESFGVLLSIPGGSFAQLGFNGGTILHDVDGDGFAEIAATYGSGSTYGAVVISGASGAVVLDTGAIYGGAPVLKSLPDLDGDGNREFGIGGWNDSVDGGAGGVRLLRGTDLTLLHFLPGPFPCARTRYFSPAGDHTHDGFEDILVGGGVREAIINGVCPPGPPLGQIRVESVLGWSRYGDPTEHALDLGRVNYASDPLQGPIVLTGGTPNGHGSLLGGFAADDMPFGPTAIPVLVDTGADFAFLIDNLPLDGSGSAQWPLDLREPVLDGVSLFLQFFDVTNGLASSNGLALRFTD